MSTPSTSGGSSAESGAGSAESATRFCGRCGLALSASAPHPACEQALQLEPPRYCPTCRRRMVVQVTPDGWTARCVEHGSLHESTWVT